MQEEVTQKTVALATNAAKMTAGVLKSMMRQYLAAQKTKKTGRDQAAKPKAQPVGKQSLKTLQKGAGTLSTVDITDENIKPFERVARKYGVTFALRKDTTENPPKYVVFFRAKDADVISRAMKEYMGQVVKDKNRPKKPSIRQRLAKAQQQSKSMAPKEKVREKEQQPQH